MLQLGSLSIWLGATSLSSLPFYHDFLNSRVNFVTKRFPHDVSLHIVEQAKTAGASSAGIVSVSDLQRSPSHRSLKTDEWAAQGKSVLVVALEHKETEPELDWWGIQGGTVGNRRLQDILEGLKAYLRADHDIEALLLPYSPGVFLKDAAVLAGIGMIGVNNLLVMPEYGPRVRLRALLLRSELTPTGPVEYSPCDSCNHPCWEACPQRVYAVGRYDRQRCQQQMAEDERNRVMVKPETPEGLPMSIVKYCRACELACPVGEGRA